MKVEVEPMKSRNRAERAAPIPRLGLWLILVTIINLLANKLANPLSTTIINLSIKSFSKFECFVKGKTKYPKFSDIYLSITDARDKVSTNFYKGLIWWVLESLLIDLKSSVSKVSISNSVVIGIKPIPKVTKSLLE